VNKLEKISVILGDVALPLIGYLFWNWNFYFILLFFLFDQASRVFFLPWRMKLTEITLMERKVLFYKQLLYFTLEIIIVHVAIYLQNQQIDFKHEIYAFLAYEDMGIQQGFVLLPLVFASEWMRIKNESKIGITGEKQSVLISKNIKNTLIRVAFFGILAALLNCVSIPEWGLVVLFLTLISALLIFPRTRFS
jgi:hypothetical protein